LPHRFMLDEQRDLTHRYLLDLPLILRRIMGQHTSNKSLVIELHHLHGDQIVDALIVDRHTSHAGKGFAKMECKVWIFGQAF